MNEIKIKCPTCGKVLRLQDAPNINAAFFTCPVCEEKHVVGKCQSRWFLRAMRPDMAALLPGREAMKQGSVHNLNVVAVMKQE